MSTLTPMMAQYREIKSKYSDCIVMFRLGDFYEMFFEDAILASKILQITLTARNKGGDGKAPMCGIPYHAIDNYLSKLTRAGKKVAICDQITEPNGKTLVEREVTRVVTPGTTFDENILQQKANNYVACVFGSDDKFALAYADITTGDFKTTELNGIKELEAELARINPAECIYERNWLEENGEVKKIFERLRQIFVFPFDYYKDPEESLKKHFEINSLSVFGLENKKLAIASSSMLLEYLKETQKTDLKHVQKISFYAISEFMPLDESCIRNLEFFFTNREGEREGSLIWVLDQTMTNMGGRMCRNWLLHPLLNVAAICERLDKIEIFVKDSNFLRDLRDKLGNIHDIERLLSRLSLGTGNARDLVALKISLNVLPEIKKLIGEKEKLSDINENIFEFEELKNLIENAIIEEAPLSVRDGGMIKKGFNQELDELLSISLEGKTFLKNLQEKEIERTGINSLKVRFNKVFGYYLEISNANLKSVPEDYIRKQTLVNAERFITPELKEYEEKILNAEEKIKNLEYELFYQVRIEVVKQLRELQKTAQSIAILDVVSNFAFIAVKNNYCKPEISDNDEIEILNGRHPVIEQIGVSKDFVPNDCVFTKERKFSLITGPNMGGKSTYLRQNALIILMAQIGCFVPAERAKISIVDKIFTRVGASDNLVRGQSTFMVEMQEASYILNNATEKSLIILDEIGRGTSTYDGVSIAWAIMEFIHDNIKAKTLFATHYHELIELAEKLESCANLSAAVRENEKEGVVFLYKIVEGGVDKSYGIEVAKLAGLPKEVLTRARGVLKELEEKHIQRQRSNIDQMDLFEERKREHQVIKAKEKSLLNELKELDLENLTPLQAMQKLNDIRNGSFE